MKKYTKLKNSKASKPSRGFALIATVTVTVLLMLVALAMFSLSSVSTRTATADKALNEARQNARVSLMMAIGQLQSLSGPDTRITASSRLLDENNVEVLGVWRSWEGINRESDGRPTIPDYDLKLETGDPASDPVDAESEGRFLGWLGSGSAIATVDDLSDFSKTENGDFIQLIGEGAVENAEDHVYVKPKFINDGESSGAIAWWTSGNAVKAMINVDRKEAPESDALVEWQERARSNGRADPVYFGLDGVNELSVGVNIPSTATLNLTSSEGGDLRKFHDITTFSRGLLTNAASGGWKKDFSLFSEQYDDLPSSDFPTLAIEPGSNFTSTRIETNGSRGNQPQDALVYPWSRYRTFNGTGWGQVPPICSWTSLVDYATQYRDLTSSSATNTAMPVAIANISGSERFNFQDQVRRAPVMARVQWIFSLTSKFLSTDRFTGVDNYNPGVLITPIVTLWNPYNVELSFDSYEIRVTQQGLAPLQFAFRVGTRPVFPLTSLPQITEGNIDFQIPATTLAPGATQIYSLPNSIEDFNSRTANVLEPGYEPGTGYKFYGINRGQTVVATQEEEFAVDRVAYSDANDEGDAETATLGVWFNNRVNDRNQALRMGYTAAELGGQTVLEALYPTSSVELSSDNLELLDGEGLNSIPFTSAIFSHRMASPVSTDPKHDHLRTKGMLLANPLTFYSEVGNQDNGNTVQNSLGSGVFHPVNAPYDFAYLDVNSWDDTLLPQVGANNSSYIVSGLGADDGLTKCIMAEIPTRPLQSLAQLQHYDVRNNNTVPPFQFNIIGNGSAHPLFAPSQIEIVTINNPGYTNDDAYMLNDLLFDDWYVSSIAPDLEDFSNGEDRDLEEVYEDHINGDEPLPNRFYIPTVDANIESVEDFRYPDSDKFTYESIASEMEIDGAFNVNSVSVDAWKSLLRHSRNAVTPVIDSDGATIGSAASDDTFPYPSTSIAGDGSVLADSISGSNPDNPQAAAIAGIPNLTETQIDALAEQIVAEVRKRGPFLSLSEFVNRQLSDDEDLAIAGTIQRALDVLSESTNSDENPYATLQSVSHNITSLPPGDTEYKFEEAAFGSSLFGVPGWIRQADILTPLGPIMTVRDDTFTIRAYGDARDRNGNIVATAWCEATVQRRADFVDPIDDKTVTPYSDDMVSEDNRRFGREYSLVSFRWLSKEEI